MNRSNTSIDIFLEKVSCVYNEGIFLAYRLTPEHIICLFKTGKTYTEVFISNTEIGQIDDIKEYSDGRCFEPYLNHIKI
ncbi:MAG: hypothetical protein KAQ62_15325 [Cyclobacteriaceae bacterium]|nr:hypothetical protein [Cyclobacteriaceae bacterium]MCK5369930.1 hypothetical protein [Cyclobacteriaceae bacterium]MCK5468361.1 hypothetical protein [Cyclobacteriaceae bacterium]